MPCCPCGGPCTYGCPASTTAYDDDIILFCFAYKYSVALSGFSGACAVFNGTWTATWKGKTGTGASCPGNCAELGSVGTSPPVIWEADVDAATQSFFRLYTLTNNAGTGVYMVICLYQGGSVVWSRYDALALNQTDRTKDCNNTLFSKALTSTTQSQTCSGGACTVSWSDTPGWSCDCNGTSSSPTATTVTLTVTNSTYGPLGNGTYTMTRAFTPNAGTEYYSFWSYPSELNSTVDFWIDISGHNGTCTGRALFVIPALTTSFANAGCTCAPLTANGHFHSGSGDFDWSIAP